MNLDLYFNKAEVHTLSEYVTCLINKNKKHKAASKINLFLFATDPCFFRPSFAAVCEWEGKEKKQRSNALWSILDQTFPKIDILKQFWYFMLLWIPCFYSLQSIAYFTKATNIAEAKHHDCTNESIERPFFPFFFLICFNSSQQPSCLLWLLHAPVEQNLF